MPLFHDIRLNYNKFQHNKSSRRIFVQRVNERENERERERERARERKSERERERERKLERERVIKS